MDILWTYYGHSTWVRFVCIHSFEEAVAWLHGTGSKGQPVDIVLLDHSNTKSLEHTRHIQQYQGCKGHHLVAEGLCLPSISPSNHIANQLLACQLQCYKVNVFSTTNCKAAFKEWEKREPNFLTFVLFDHCMPHLQNIANQ